MLRLIKNHIRRRRLAKAGVAVEIACPTAVYGSGEGSWAVCPEGITPASVVYSFGIGRDLSFDLDMVGRHGVAVHAFDPTPVAVQWAREQVLPDSLHVHEYGLAGTDGEIEFYAPRKATSAHFTPVKRYRHETGEKITAPVKSLPTIMAELGHARVDVLKMDIEGGEYGVVESIVRHGIPIGQLLVEFHHCYKTIPMARTVEAVNRLRGIGFKVFSISERTYEISLILAD
ncbi:MAG: FkbM family methyltransferase [Lentisphaeria bacterium]|jgi:FkbM family methyltransferase|nr:FkbM family methyltransferase [Lentisphaeria bacterium]